MNVIITILIVLLLSYIVTRVSKKIKVPSVVALISLGLIFDISWIKTILIEPNSEFIFVVGDFALLCLMFLAGLESSWHEMCEEKKDASYIAIFASVTPLLIGFCVFVMLGYSILISAIVGICMSITAEATKARVLIELGKLKTKVGSAMMGAGIIDDIIGLGLFLIIIYFMTGGVFQGSMIIAGAIFMFFFGIIAQKSLGRGHKSIKYLERILLIFVVPFFFISTGLHFDVSSFSLSPILPIIIIIAISGKMIGSLLVKSFTNFSFGQLHLIGWAMNSRGVIELGLALIAFRTGLIPANIYSSLVIMALVTTLIFPFIINLIVKRNPKIMN